MGHYESDALVGREAAGSECLPTSSVVSTYGVGKGSFTTQPMYELVSYIEKCFAQRLREALASGHFSSDTMREIAVKLQRWRAAMVWGYFCAARLLMGPRPCRQGSPSCC